MTPRKLDVCFATFPYGGNGASASECPESAAWVGDTIPKARADERISKVSRGPFNDTPITMTRNEAVIQARQIGADVLVMVDSDQWPDMEMELGRDPTGVPFWETAFDFIYDRWDRGPHCVSAPYMGGPPHENCFVFRWATLQSDTPDEAFQLRQYTREEAAVMAGIHECAALPTGLIMFDMRCFDLIEPSHETFAGEVEQYLRPQIGQPITEEFARQFSDWANRRKAANEHSFFYYEYSDRYEQEKSSTEDVTATRDISIAGQMRLGYNPVHCAWSSWAGHWKPKCVGKPMLLPSDFVSSKLTRAAREGCASDMRQIDVRLRGSDHRPRPHREEVTVDQ